MTNSIIVIKGNYLNKVANIFECFKYNDLDQDKTFDNAMKFNEYLFDNYFEFANREIALRGIWFDNGWTIICDPEMVDTVDDEALLKLSKKLQSDVLTFIIQTTSGSFGFAKFNKTKDRYFFSTDGEVSDNIGLPSTEEQGLNLNEKVFVDDILKLANNFGIDLEGKSSKSFIVKQLGYNDEMKKELEQFKQAQTNQTTDTKKPWWKIW
jgi:hypothetical protein